MMCYRPQKLLLIFAVLTNVLMLIYLANLQDQIYFMQENKPRCVSQSTLPVVQHSISIVIREFESFQNNVPHLVSNILEKFDDDVSVLLLADSIPYPPLDLVKSPRVRSLSLATDLNASYQRSHLDQWITSDYVLIVPDGIQLTNKSRSHMIDILWDWSSLKDHPQTKVIAWPVANKGKIECLGLNVNLKQWTLQYYKTSGLCDALQGGAFVLGIKREHLFQLTSPFARPLHEAFFIQTANKGWKVAIQSSQLWTSHGNLFEDAHSSWKSNNLGENRLTDMYKDFGIKLVQRSDGEEELYGCHKDTERCFGSILNDMPDYLYTGRWTPPCCLRAIRITARHVFRILEQQGVRYWLEGGSLLGAVRSGDLIPWDYDTDIGIYQEDIEKSSHLQAASQQPFEDEDGFIWETASEGEYFRVQYSEVNRLHVDIFPFRPVNGNMTKNTWLKTHRQDMPFPEHFLKPLVKINFVGSQAYAPNNREDFLELKFGKGAITNPKYPDTSVVN